MDSLIVPLSSPEAVDANRFGPKAANQAALGQAGLPIPDGFCIDAAAYRLQLAALDLESSARGAFAASDPAEARQHALRMKLELLAQPIAEPVVEPLLEAWRALVARTGEPTVVRSSALVEDRDGANFAGQFESYLGIEHESEFLTAVRACWAALWSTRALRYMATHDLDPADTAMAVLVQPLVAAKAAGGGLSRTATGEMVVTATWGLGSAIAQGEVTPDRFELSLEGELLHVAVGQKDHSVGCTHRTPATQAVPRALASKPCLESSQISDIARLLRRAEEVQGGPVEIEWALDEGGFKLLQARPLGIHPAHVPDEIWLQHPRVSGHPAGVGWGVGRAVVINCECELSRVATGDVLVTRVAGPALAHVLSRVAGVVTERGGSTSHFASLARERGIPMVLGVDDATRRIPDGAQVAVDGVAGIVRWMRSSPVGLRA
ncbi:MAG: PEP/pyruvate-binding domain-containing protein [Acidobacteriota bacterium]